MVLTNSASRSRNMVQTNNQPQAADFGSIFSSVAVTAYGARNRRQRGVYNIDFWSANRPKTTAGPNTGRSVTGTRGSAWNVRGTSAHSRLIDDVTFSVQGLARATAAELTANTVFSTASDNRININNQYGDDAISAIVTAINSMITYLSTTLPGLITLSDDQDAKRNDLVNINFENLKTFNKNENAINIMTGDIYDHIDDYNRLHEEPNTKLNIYNIRDINKALQREFVLAENFILNDVGLTDTQKTNYQDNTSIKFNTANTITNAAFTAEMAYKDAYNNEIATNNAKTAAQATLATANSRLY